MWLALHAHRQVHPQQYTLIIQHIEETCRVLGRWIHGTSVKTAESNEPPQQVRTARKAKGKTASVRAVAAATRKPKAAKVVPTTPKRPRSKYVTLNSFVVSKTRLPPRVRSVSRDWIFSRTQGRERRHAHAEIVSPDRITSEYVRFCRAPFLLNCPSPLDMAIHLVGFIGHVILKLELLQVARQVCEHPSIGQHDGKRY
jgi:hypothetical protein